LIGGPGIGLPAGFGFIAGDWQPRLALAGTYDEAWTKKRAPLLPKDFDRRFFNAATPGLVTADYLAGNEKVLVLGATAEGRWEFRLPGIEAPRCLVATKTDPDRELVTNLQDRRRRHAPDPLCGAFTTLANGHDLRALRITCANAPAPRSCPPAFAGAF
jgi:hypothetical protein